jgi:hypothetical protein
MAGSVHLLVDGPSVAAFILSPGLGGMAGVVAATIAGATALAVSRSDREQRERAERKGQWWARARWALDLLMADDPRRRLIGYRVLGELATSEWSDEHEAGMVASATEVALRSFQTRRGLFNMSNARLRCKSLMPPDS